MSLVPPKFSIASLSLGSSTHHSLPTKIAVASALGYQGIEIFLPDFEAFVNEVKLGHHSNLFTSPVPTTPRALEHACAVAISALCKSRNIAIPIIQPLRGFENFLDPSDVDDALNRAERWLELLPDFDCDLLLVCSNLIEGPHPIHSGRTTLQAYVNMQVYALSLLGERASRHNARIGYEPLAWGTVINRWEHVWEVVRRVDMPNVGVILDSFNVLGNLYADPSTPTSLRAGITLPSVHANLSLLQASINASKIFFYQIADAHRPLAPIEDRPGAPARMTWSRSSRLFPNEDPTPSYQSLAQHIRPSQNEWIKTHTGFLPVTDMTRTLFTIGYTGWWSLEVFNLSLAESDEDCPARHGKRGMKGLQHLWEDVRGDAQQPAYEAAEWKMSRI